MSEISMIGLGAMGSALARALLEAGHGLTVWNRTPQKMEPFAALGAETAESALEAVQASPLIMVCIDNYAKTNKLLGAADVAPHLSGRTLIQLSTGTPAEARASEAWMNECGANYLDGIIEPYPDGIGKADARIMVAGSKTVFARTRAVFDCLGGDNLYLGENIAAPATLDLASLTVSLATYVGVAHANRLCEAEGVGVDLYASIHPKGSRVRELAEIVHADDYKLKSLHDGASIRIWEECIQRIQSQARDTQMNSELPDFLSSIFKRAGAAGYGEEDLAALIKVLRN